MAGYYLGRLKHQLGEDPPQHRTIALRYLLGESYRNLAVEFGMEKEAIKNICYPYKSFRLSAQAQEIQMLMAISDALGPSD